MNRTYPPFFSRQKGLLHGADYNPEQWPESIWAEDSRLMEVAGFTSVSVGIFSWVSLEPAEGHYTFDWLDRVLDIQAEAGRSVFLATPSAAVPAWMSRKYPEVLRTGPDRVRRLHANRVNTCWSSPVFREKTAEIDRRLAERYAGHPALAAWHVSNEYGGYCFCDLCAARFRTWLRDKYGSLDALNQAYWTAFWSHTFTDREEIQIPGDPIGGTSILGLTLDWKRFSSWQIVDFFLHEKGVLNEVSPGVPCTTNLMGTYDVVDGFEIARHLDFVSWDSYPWFHGRPDEAKDWTWTSFCHDLNRSLKNGQPFLLMECSPSSSNWYKTMHLKRPGQNRLEGLQAIAHGADGVQYFQWRQSRGSLEQFHGGVVAHNNRESAKVFQDVVELGTALKELGDVVGSRVESEVAVIFDWEVMWATQTLLGYRTSELNYSKAVFEHYLPFADSHTPVDIVESTADLTRYKIVIAPMLFLLRPGVAENLARFVEAGGTLVTTCWSAWVDVTGLAFHGGYPEPLASALGIWSEEMDELYADQRNGFEWQGKRFEVRDYCERIHCTTAEPLATYTDHFYAGEPILTRNRFGKGAAYMIAGNPEPAFLKAFYGELCNSNEIRPAVEGQVPTGVSVRKRSGGDKDFLFVLNYNQSTAQLDLSSEEWTGPDGMAARVVELPAFGTAVLTRARDKSGIGAAVKN